MIWVCLVSPAALACRYTVRDVGFVDLGEPVYHLHLVVRGDSPREMTEAFRQASHVVLLDGNVNFEVVDVDRQKDHPSVETVNALEIDAFPAAVLVSPQDRAIRLPIPTGKPAKEAARTCLEGAVTSPARAEIRKHIIPAYCVVLLIEGKDAAENGRVGKLVEGVIDEIAEMMGQMPKPTEHPPRLIRVPQKRFADERVLLWSLGIEPDAVDGPRVAALYGRGRWIGPMFAGEDITEHALGDVLSLIGASCECGLDRRLMLGVRLPLRWSADAVDESVKSVGFDPENPMVKMEMSRILSRGPTSSGRFGGGETLGLAGYSEQVIEFSSGPNDAVAVASPDEDRAAAGVNARPRGAEVTTRQASRVPTAVKRPAPASRRALEPRLIQPDGTELGTEADSALDIAWVVVGGLAVVILAGGVFILVRSQRSKS